MKRYHTLFAFVISALFLTACDKAEKAINVAKDAQPATQAAQAKPATSAQPETTQPVYVKDLKDEFRQAFLQSFNQSCIAEAVKASGKPEASEAIKTACDCSARKAEEVLTLDDVAKMQAAKDNSVAVALRNKVLKASESCLQK